MIREQLKNRYFLIIAIVAGIAGFVFFNTSFRSTLSRFRAIHSTQIEYAKVSAEVDQLKSKIASLESNPQGREDFVRRDLGYIRPGEKEIRFVPTSTKEK